MPLMTKLLIRIKANILKKPQTSPSKSQRVTNILPRISTSQVFRPVPCHYLHQWKVVPIKRFLLVYFYLQNLILICGPYVILKWDADRVVYNLFSSYIRQRKSCAIMQGTKRHFHLWFSFVYVWVNAKWIMILMRQILNNLV